MRKILVYPALPPEANLKGNIFLMTRVTWSEPAAVFYYPLIVGASANNASANGGAFTFNVNNAPSNTNWNNGCGQSYQSETTTKNQKPTHYDYKSKANNVLCNPHPLVKIARCRPGIVDRRIPRYEISGGDKICKNRLLANQTFFL